MLPCPRQQTVVFELVAETLTEAEIPTPLWLFPPVVSTVTDVVLPAVIDKDDLLLPHDVLPSLQARTKLCLSLLCL